MTDRESMPVDVVIVGAGPSGLSAAIRLKQLADAADHEISIVVLEKAAEIGAHILSGAVIDPVGLDTLISDWRNKGAPLTTKVTDDRFVVLSKTGGITIPHVLLPPMFSNRGNYVASLGQVCHWLGAQAEQMGIDIYPGFAATEILYDGAGNVMGVATGDMASRKTVRPVPILRPVWSSMPATP